MKYVYTYESPLGTMVMAGTGSSLTNLDFKGQLYMPDFGADYTRKDTALFKRVAAWLDEYFLGKKPDLCRWKERSFEKMYGKSYRTYPTDRQRHTA